MNESRNVRDIGSVVANRYALIRHLGTGRYGEVYEAVDRSLSGSVALHLLNDRIAQQTRLLRKIEASYQQPHTWSHTNVVKVRGFGNDAGRFFVVMEWLEGDTLRALLDETPSQPPAETEAFAILRGIGDALKHAHARGAIHGDLRPEKIFLTTDRTVKVLDLLPGTVPRNGLFFVEDTSPTSLAPPDQRDDVYGLACIAYELLTGKHPFDGRSPRVASSAGMAPAPISALGAQRWAALARGLALRREERTPNIAVFLVELGVAKSEPQGAAKPGSAQRPARQQAPAASSASAPSAAPAPSAPRAASGAHSPGAPRAGAAAYAAPASAFGALADESPRTPSAPPPPEPAFARDDDMPIIGDYSGSFAKVPDPEPEPPPAPEPLRRPSAPAADNPWRIDPRDVRRHTQQRKKSSRDPGDVAFRLGGLLLGGIVAFAIFSNYDMLRERAAAWIDVARNGPAQVPSALPERGSENETIEVQAPTVVPTPDLPPEQGADAAPQAAAPAGGGGAGGPAGGASPRGPAEAPRTNATLGGERPQVDGAQVAAGPAAAGASDRPGPEAAAPAAERAARPGESADRAADAAAPAAEPAAPAAEPAAPAADSAAPPGNSAARAAAPAAPVEPESFSFQSSVVTVSESQPGVRVTIRRRGGTRGESAVVWWTSDGSALAGEDYANLGTSTEKFAAGEDARSILVPIVGDAKAEGRESFYVNLGDPSQPASRVPIQRIEVVIEDDD